MDNISKEAEKAKRGEPIPQRFRRKDIGCLSILFSPFVGGLMLYWNWKQLGETQRAQQTLLYVFLGIPLVQIVYMLVVLLLARNAEVAQTLVFPIFIWLVSLLPLDFLYRRYHRVYTLRYGTAYARYPLSLGCLYVIGGLFLGGAFSVAITQPLQATVLEVVAQSLPAQTYADDQITFSYPGDWKTFAPETLPFCEDNAFLTCLIEVGSFRQDMIFYAAQISSLVMFGQSLEDVETTLWQEFQKSQSVESLALRNITLDGYAAVQRDYKIGQLNFYGSYILVATDNAVFIIEIRYDQVTKVNRVQAIFDSIQFPAKE